MGKTKGPAGLLLALFLFGCVEEAPLVKKMWAGDDAMKRGAYEEAAFLYGAVAEAPPGAIDDTRRAGAYVNRANSFIRLSRWDEAEADYGRALKLAPTMAEAVASRGTLLDTLGRREEAMRDYRRALALNPALGEPPGFFARLMGNAEVTPTIADRLAFLEKTVGMGEATESSSDDASVTSPLQPPSSPGAP